MAKKNKKKNQSKSKFYAVQKGHKPGVYTSWDECKEQTSGFSGAVYKAFPTKDEAEAYVNIQEIKEHTSNNIEGVSIYTDGSFNEKTSTVGYGIVVVKDGKIVAEHSGTGEAGIGLDLRNITGELYGAMNAASWAIAQNVPNITLCHDYMGVATYALGLHEPDSKLEKMYALKMKRLMEKVKVEFTHVKGHSGNEYNERADILAKKGAGIC